RRKKRQAAAAAAALRPPNNSMSSDAITRGSERGAFCFDRMLAKRAKACKTLAIKGNDRCSFVCRFKQAVYTFRKVLRVESAGVFHNDRTADRKAKLCGARSRLDWFRGIP